MCFTSPAWLHRSGSARVIFLSGSADHVDRAEAMIHDFVRERVANRTRGKGQAKALILDELRSFIEVDIDDL